MNRIKAVFFDLGSTLVYSKDPWPPFYERADRALAGQLHSSGIEIDPTVFFTELGGFLPSYYENHSKNNLEDTAFSVLCDILDQKGYRNIPETVIRKALKAMYAITQENWVLEEDALTTLEKIRSQGYRMGMISNTGDDGNIQGIVDRWGLRQFFEIILTSAAQGIRKPDPRIFQIALDHFHFQPQEAAMVGDLLETDVLGANQLGIYSIWITRRALQVDEGELIVQPQAIVSTLQQIPDLLSEIKDEPE